MKYLVLMLGVAGTLAFTSCQEQGAEYAETEEVEPGVEEEEQLFQDEEGALEEEQSLEEQEGFEEPLNEEQGDNEGL